MYRLLLFTWCLTWGIPIAMAASIKEPNVAGSFYPVDAHQLERQVKDMVSLAPSFPIKGQVKVLIAPHAGYVYSGSVAGYSFKAVAQQPMKTVVVIAPSHHFPFQGAAIWPQGAFKTPLGTISVDEDFSKALLNKTPVLQTLPEVFDKEHALEVKLPFIQHTFGSNVKVVGILMGQPDIGVCEHLARALTEVIGSRQDVLVVISSDMSHYHPYAVANQMDAGTLSAIVKGDIKAFWEGNISGQMEMCGFVGVTVGMMLAKLQGLETAQVLTYANSGDTAKDKSRVVGYGSVVFYHATPEGLSPIQKKFLLDLARTTIETYVRDGTIQDFSVDDPALRVPQGAFVTIHQKGQLRGCIGHIIAQDPLARTVRDMAIAAASQDPRFPPVTVKDLSEIEIEISVLSVPVKVSRIDQIVLGQHGVIVSDKKGHQGVFLPQVAVETGWSKEQFLSELCAQKAGLSPEAWKGPGVELFIFTAEVFGKSS